MTEQQPDQQPPQLPEPTDPPEPVKARSGAAAEPTRYAVYDDTLTQYVGPVTTRKPSKADAAKLVRKGHDFTIREV